MKNNFCVIMAGGVGSRFWPFSTNERPKQFLDLFGMGRTLLQMTFDRFKRIMPVENIYIASNTLYKDLILEQLPEITENQVLLEPARRNTAPCICYAVNKIMALNENANIVVSPSDHLILKEDEFVEIVKRGLNFTENNDCLLTLGIKPSRPETGYGYIEEGPSVEGTELLEVNSFREKPCLEVARSYHESGRYLWNAGIFVWNVNTITKALRQYAPSIAAVMDEMAPSFYTEKEEETVTGLFPQCEKISIDYAVMEKADCIYTLPADFGWSDLGTWGSLRSLMPCDGDGNAIVGNDVRLYDSRGCIVHAPELSKVVVQGLEGYIVAQHGDRLLVCRLDSEQNITNYAKD